MQLALYKGPAKSLPHKAVHLGICALDSVRQSVKHRRLVLVPYSHCELVIHGICYSASSRDGGVRAKVIDLTTGRWDVFPIESDEAAALKWFSDHDGQNYDWCGALRFLPLLAWLPLRLRHWFCSEACTAARGVSKPHLHTPYDLVDHLVKAAVLMRGDRVGR